MIRTANLTASVSRNAGGLFESVRRLVQSLAQNDMDVRVFGVADEFTHADVGAWQPVQVLAFPPVWPKKFGYSPEFLHELECFRPDLTHTHGIWVYASVATNRYCRNRGVPYVISPHGMLDPWAMRNSRWKKVVAHFLYEGTHLREAGCLRALCESEARAIRALGLVNPIAIIPNGIDLPENRMWKAESDNPPWARVVEPGRKVLFFLSRIHPKKGLPSLLKAWAAIQKEGSDERRAEEWVLAIAGWDQGGHEGELKRLATELDITWADVRGSLPQALSRGPAEPGAAVREQGSASGLGASLLFLGPQFNQAKAACYANCDAFILPSLSEGVPMVVLEAWAHAKPVLLTPECNLPEAFELGAARRIETTPESITAGLHAFFGTSDFERQQMGLAGLELVRKRFVWPHIGREMTELYKWLLGGGAKPACLADF